MRLARCFIIVAVIIAGAFGAAHCIEDSVNDYDGNGWNIGTWGGGYEVGIATAEPSSAANHPPIAGNSEHIYWSYGAAAGRYGGGNTHFNNASVDVSTYSALSFWIYTPNANTDINIQIQDHADFGDDMGRVKLTDYLVTGSNVWQNVIIPLEAFKRDNKDLDLKIKEIKWMSEYDQGNDISGSIYIDDLKFLDDIDAPANSRVYSGGDKGLADQCDIPGDTLMTWDQAASSTTSNVVDVLVSTGFACAWASTPLDKGAIQGTTIYFAYQIRNDGNAADSIAFSSQVVQGSTWSFRIYWDKDKSGTYTTGDTPYDNTIGLAPSATHYFLAGVLIPDTAVLWSSSTIRITAKDRNGAGTEDNWPSAGNDTITDDFIAVASNTISGVSITVARSSAAVDAIANGRMSEPGDKITYTISYPNIGDTAGTGMLITEAIPFNTEFDADPGDGDADSNQFYVGSAWQDGYDAAATKVRWVDASVPGGSNCSVSYTVKIKHGSGNPKDDTVNDFDGTTWGGSNWGGIGDNMPTWGGGSSISSVVNHTPGGSNSFYIWWRGCSAAGRWGGGALTSYSGIDISTYSALSFWIYSSTQNVSLNVQLQDNAGDDIGRVLDLRDYLVTGTSVWQNVIIPLEAFKRNNQNLDYLLKEIKWFSEYDLGNNTVDADIYIDDVKFLKLSQAPANSFIMSGSDKGIANTADYPGDSFAYWTQQGSSSTFSEMNVKVSTGYAAVWSSVPADKGTYPGTTIYFEYKIINNGNLGDSVHISTAYVQNCSTWPVTVYWDKDKSGTYTAGDYACWALPDIAPNATGYFLVGVYLPSETVMWSSATISVTANDHNGSGANDSWPSGTDDDTITDSFIAIASNSVSGVSISVARSSAAVDAIANGRVSEPGDKITYTISYPNIGDTAGTGMLITEAIPFNTELDGDPGNGAADSNQFYVSGAWQDAYNATATKVRWVDASVDGGTSNSVSYTVRIKHGSGNTVDDTVADFDTGGPPTNWGAGTWARDDKREYNSNIRLTPSGYSYRMWWSSMVDWVGGGINNLSVDVSTYSAMSFWIYTPNADTSCNVQLVDNSGKYAKVQLQEQLITGTSVWQNVIIPLDRFLRNADSGFTLTNITDIKWISEASMSNDVDGDIYLDDVKFLVMSQTPANSLIVSGSDKGIANTADIPGDSFAYWDQQGSSTTFSEMSIKVSTGYASAWGSVPDDKGTLPGTTAYFSYKIINEGNLGDSVHISTAYVQGCSTWPVTVYWDKDKSGTYTADDYPCWALPDIGPNATGYFLVGVYLPSETVMWSSATITVTAKDHNGSGANDSWPSGADDDTITDSFVAIASNAVSGVSISVARSSAAVDTIANGRVSEPGDKITYTISYPNIGDTAGTGMLITEAIPFNTEFDADPGAGYADSNQFYVGSAWQDGWDATATKVRWVDASVGGGTSNSVSYTVKIKNGNGNNVEETVANFDSGSNPIDIGGGIWGNPFAEYSTLNHSPASGYSLELRWNYTDPDWGGGGLNGMAVDISTYNAISFWIYTPNANTDLNVQIQDQDASGNETGYVQLQDYLTTGTSVWQNVIIPFEAFRRSEPNLDFVVKEIKWIAETSKGNDSSGRIYIDDVKLLNLPQAPANSLVISGGDKWTANTADCPGDSFVYWDQQGSSTTFSEMNVRVSTCYAASFSSVPSDLSVSAAGDYYFAYKLVNNGNLGDNISLTPSVDSGQAYSSSILWDRNNNGSYDAGTDFEVFSTSGLQPNCTFPFLVKVIVPSDAVGGQPTTMRVTAKTNYGDGNTDNWPVNPSASSVDDTITDDFVMEVSTVYAVTCTHEPSQATQNLNPGATAYFAYTFRNDGNVPDIFSLSVTTVAGNAWNVWITSDTNHNSLHTEDEFTVVANTVALSPAQSFYCFVAINIPPAAVGSATARITVRDHDGTGSSGTHIAERNAIALSSVDNTAPVITILKSPPANIGMIGNKILLVSEIIDIESELSSVTLTYWIGSQSKAAQTLTATSTIYTADFNDLVAGNCTIRYYLTAVNQWGYTSWSSTGIFSVSQITKSDNFSSGKLLVDDGNPDDGNTSIDIPAGALKDNINLIIVQNNRDDSDVPRGNAPANSVYPSTVYDFKDDDGSTKGKDVTFKKPVTLTLLYMETDKDGYEDSSGKDERFMRVFWWDNYEWRLIGGKVDITNKTVTAKIMHLSKYAVFPIKSLTADDYRAKERILTPAGSPGKNDFCQFGVSGDNVKINIFDVNGAKVRELKDGVNIWDGKDEDDEIVESGVYIYQIKTGNETVSGTILIIK
ncbi:MAG: gliding motility-associated C-terminal domain-containing protein [Elusimicrobiota bacterium]